LAALKFLSLQIEKQHFDCYPTVQKKYDRLLGKICEEIPYGDERLTFPEGGHDSMEIASNDIECTIHLG